MKKRSEKRYTTLEKVNYHLSRARNENVNKNKRLYSREWLRGFTDDHAGANLRPVMDEYLRELKRGKASATTHAFYKGDINGKKEQLRDGAWKIRREHKIDERASEVLYGVKKSKKVPVDDFSYDSYGRIKGSYTPDGFFEPD